MPEHPAAHTEASTAATSSAAASPASGRAEAGPPPIAVVTVSDRAASGLRADVSGPLAARLLGKFGDAAAPVVVPDDVGAIRRAILEAIAGGARVVFTTGGTGITSRDVTPEATRELVSQRIAGIENLLRDNPRVPAAALSRGVAGVVDHEGRRAFVVNAPGSPGGVRDAVGVIGARLAHIVEQLDDGDHMGDGGDPMAGMDHLDGASHLDGGGHLDGEPADGGGHLDGDPMNGAGHHLGGLMDGGRHTDDAGHREGDDPTEDIGHADGGSDPEAGGEYLESGAHRESGTHLETGGRPGASAHEAATRRIQNRGTNDGRTAEVVLAQLGPEPIAMDGLADLVDEAGAGAVVTFRGQVRDHDEGRHVVAIEYAAHPQAGHVLRDVAEQAGRTSGARKVAVAHRTGRLGIGEVALGVAVSAAHRAEAMRVLDAVVEGVKMRLPVWKRQTFADGTSEWAGQA